MCLLGFYNYGCSFGGLTHNPYPTPKYTHELNLERQQRQSSTAYHCLAAEKCNMC